MLDLEGAKLTLRKKTRDLVGVRNQKVNLGSLYEDGPDLNGESLLIIGAEHESGYALNLGRAAYLRGAVVTVTALDEKAAVKIKENHPFLNVMICDVTDTGDLRNLRDHVKDTYDGFIDHVVVAPAYLKPDIFSTQHRWSDLTKEMQDESLEITSYAIVNVAAALQGIKVGGMYGLSFLGEYTAADGSIDEMPGYNISGAKQELERLVLGNGREVGPLANALSYNGTRVNIFTLFPFPTVASKTTESEAFIRDLVPALKIKEMDLAQILEGSLYAMMDPTGKTGFNYNIDNGLRKKIESSETKKTVSKTITRLAKKHRMPKPSD